MLAQRRLDVLRHGQRREQGAALEHHAGPALDIGLGTGVVDVAAEDLDMPALGPLEAEDGVEQHRLAGARAADDGEDLAAADLEVEAVMDDIVAEGAAQPAHPHRRRKIGGRVHRSSCM